MSASRRRTLAWPAFGLLFCVLVLWAPLASDAAPLREKLVTLGPPRVVSAAGKVRVQPRVAVADRIVVELSAPLRGVGKVSLSGKTEGTYGRHLGRNMYVMDLPAGTDVVAAAAAMRGRPGVLAAAPDTLMYPALVPNDPHYSDQYHLPQIQAPLGWGVTTGSPNVVIAIIDSGVYLAHPDLAPNIWTNPGEIAGNGKDDDNNGFVDDVHGWDFYDNNNDPNPSPNGRDDDGNGEADEEVNHGTLVAGTAAAAGNDGYGCAGVAWGCKIMPIQVFPDDGGTPVSNVVAGINYAVANHANVINLSIGGGYTDLFTAPITAAYNAGVVVVCAAGNDGQALTDSESTWESPVCNEGDPLLHNNHLIGVGAVDRYDRKASYSNFDSSHSHFVDIMAPGDAIYGDAAYFPDFPAFTSYFQTNSGTSFSSPIIAGLVALLISHNPPATPSAGYVDDIISLIDSSGDNIDSLNAGYVGKLGGGRINCARALGVPVPPAAAQDLAAADTTGDDGGSITVTWIKSPDDGGGSGKVASYTLFRRTGASGTFAKVAVLAKGTESYVDTAVTDGTDYYYKLRTSDGTLTSDTAIVGPAQSRNDQPPTAVSGMVAYDRPNDTGKAIVITWSAYTAPADFQQFAIYRSTSDFATTAALTPIAFVTNTAVVSYTDTTVSDGVDYYYAVGVRDTAGNELRTLRAFGPVQSFSNDAIVFPAGLQLLGPATVPADSDPATLFGLTAGSFPYAVWSPTDSAYVYDTGQRPLSAALQLELGRGFWVKFASPVTVRPVGSSAPAGDFNIDLTPGWHQLANPFFAPINFADAAVTYQGATMDLASADSLAVLAAVAWLHDSSSQSYVLAYPPLDSQTTLIPAWRGFWVLCHKACTLTISRPLSGASVATASARAVRKSSVAAAKVDWTITLRVSSAAGADSACYAGIASRALTLAKPPPAGDAPVLTMGAGNASEAGAYAVSLAQSTASSVIWKMQIKNLKPGQPVSVTAPDLSHLPAQSTAVLEDLVTGETLYLRTSSGYVFTPRAGETARQFSLTVTPRGAAGLQVQTLSAQASRSGGAEVSFTLSASAACTVSVRNIAGREVRRVEEEKLHPAGSNTVLWDGRNQVGARVPRGMYLLQLTAKTTTGQSVTAIRRLNL